MEDHPVWTVSTDLFHSNYVGQGIVDGSTPDGLILWVHLDGMDGRRMFHREDNIILETC